MNNPFLSVEPPSTEKAPAVEDWNPDTAGADIAALMEIADARFKLNVAEFMAAVEDIPLFLRRAG